MSLRDELELNCDHSALVCPARELAAGANKILRDEIARLKAERDHLIQAAADHVTVRGGYYERMVKAEAAAGAMREALGWALAVIENLPSFRRERDCFVTLLESENEGFTAEWRKARKAASAAIGAEAPLVPRRRR